MDFLPSKVIHNVEYSCWKPQCIGKIESNKILVFTKVCLAEFFLSGNLQKFIHAKLKNFANFWPHKTFYSITVQISKLVNLNSIFFWEFSMCVTYVKTFAGVPDHICSVCNRWTLLTFSQKSVSEMLMYQFINNLKYLIGCWISHDFTFKNVLIWFVISRTCELKMSFGFLFLYPVQQIFYKNMNIGKYYKYKYL